MDHQRRRRLIFASGRDLPRQAIASAGCLTLGQLIGLMPRFRCPDCCCGPAIVLRPPKGATPICSRCGTVLERQPVVRPIPLVIFLGVSASLIVLSVPSLFFPQPAPPRQPSVPIEPTDVTESRHPGEVAKTL